MAAFCRKPYKSTTGGKSERFHRALHRFLNKQEPAATIEALQNRVDAFDEYYNTEREHQSLPARMTPQQAWDATDKTAPPKAPMARITKDSIRRSTRKTASRLSVVTVVGTHFQVGRDQTGETIHISTTCRASCSSRRARNGSHHPTCLPRGTKYVGNNKPGGFMTNQMPTMS